jgi:alpha-tubulin suppressor-like RCC1 family protein
MKKSAFLAKKTLILLLTFILVAGPLFIADQVHAAGLRFTSISSQLYSSLALDSNQEIWAWGSNDSGQFGDGTTDAAYSFVPKKIEVLDGGTPVKFQVSIVTEN